MTHVSPPRRTTLLRSLAVLAALAIAAPALTADCNSNGLDDLQDIASGKSHDCNRDNIPDECDILAVSYGLELAAQALPPPEGGTISMAAIDFDGDADLDLAATAGNGRVALYQNLGGLNFKRPTAVPPEVAVGDRPEALTAADLDGDGSSDLATANRGSDSVTVLLNDRHGVFSTVSYPVVGLPQSLAIADFDGDGDLDLAVIGATEPDQVDVLFNTRTGAFGPPVRIALGAAGNASVSVTAADLDGDYKPDLVASPGNHQLLILRNSGGGVFEEALSPPVPGHAATLADVDGDGDLDVVTDQVAVYRNPGDGRFTQPVFLHEFDVVYSEKPKVGDLDADGVMDLVARGRVFIGLGGVKFSNSPYFQELGEPMIADLDGAGRPEVVNQYDQRIYRSRLVAYSRDCNGNNIPDECDMATELSHDCNGNLIPDECDLAEGLSHDCNDNGILDICENDCNLNGIEDSCDLAAGIGEDLDHDGRIDHCDPVFTYGFDAPAAVQGMPGETRTFDVYLTLGDENNFTGEGAMAWSLSLFADGGTVKAITVKGIVVDTIYDDRNGVHHDPYPFDLADSFTRIANLGQHWQDPSKKGAISAVVMKSQEHMALQPRRPQRIARLSVEARIPAGGACAPVSIHYENGGRSTVSGPVYNVVTFKGRSYPPVLGSTTILICPTQFRRGDANSDRLVDISDPIFTLSYLFLGGQAPACLEAGNANDDALLDLSDPVYLLESLFLGGGLGRIAAPGAYACGTGGAFRGLPCDDSPCPLEISGGP